MPLVDTHCHLDDPVFNATRGQLLHQAALVGIRAIIVPAITASGLQRIQQLANEYSGVHAAAGLHPLYMDQHDPQAWQEVLRYVEAGSVLAIGECGLDYAADSVDRAAQQVLFEQHVELAQSSQLPLIIHAHRAVEDVLQCVRRYQRVTGVIHSFNGSAQQADAFIEQGFKLGFGGAVTHPRATRLRQLITSLPLEALLLETDAPYQTGHQHRGETNQPAWITEVCEVVANLQQRSAKTIAEKTTATAVELFKLDLIY